VRTIEAAGLPIGPDEPSRIMGVLNVSRESPYSPSVYDDSGEAAEYVDEELIAEGADIVDVGLESANKRLDVLSADQELDRLDTAIETMESTSGDAVWSIETRYAEVAETALDAGYDMVNDVCGFADPQMPAVCEEYDVAVCKMAGPPDLERPGAVDDVDWTTRRSRAWVDRSTYVDRVYEALKQNGFTEKTIVDPAFGGWSERKTVADDRELFRRLGEFREFGRPMLVSINRKNFLRQITGRSTEAALPVSLAATSMAVERGARVVRTHDVQETVDAAMVGDAFADAGGPAGATVSVTEMEAGEDRVGDDRTGERVFAVGGLTAAAAAEFSRAASAVDAVVRSGPGPDGLLLGVESQAIGALAERLPATPALTTVAGRLRAHR